MRRMGIILTVVVLVLVLVVVGAWAQVQKPPQPASKIESSAQLLSIFKVRGPEMTMFLNKQVTIEGLYYDGSIPMVIDDIKEVIL